MVAREGIEPPTPAFSWLLLREVLEGHHQVQLRMPGEVSNVWLSVRAIIAEVFKILVVGGDGTVRA